MYLKGKSSFWDEIGETDMEVICDKDTRLCFCDKSLERMASLFGARMLHVGKDNYTLAGVGHFLLLIRPSLYPRVIPI